MSVQADQDPERNNQDDDLLQVIADRQRAELEGRILKESDKFENAGGASIPHPMDESSMATRDNRQLIHSIPSTAQPSVPLHSVTNLQSQRTQCSALGNHDLNPEFLGGRVSCPKSPNSQEESSSCSRDDTSESSRHSAQFPPKDKFLEKCKRGDTKAGAVRRDGKPLQCKPGEEEGYQCRLNIDHQGQCGNPQAQEQSETAQGVTKMAWQRSDDGGSNVAHGSNAAPRISRTEEQQGGSCVSSSDIQGQPGAYSLRGFGFDSQQEVAVGLQVFEAAEGYPDDADPSENTQNESGLVVATAIDSCAKSSDLPQAEELDLEAGSKIPREAVVQSLLKYILAAIIGLVAVVVVLVFLLEKEDSTTLPPLQTSYSPSQAPSVSFNSYVFNLLPESTQASTEEPDSPQSKAYQWLLNDPNGTSYTEARLIQRFALATFYFATNGEKWVIDRNWLSYDHHECGSFNGRGWFMGNLAHAVATGNIGDDYMAQKSPLLSRLDNESWPCGTGDESEVFHHFWLFFNNLKGQIPDEIYLLTSLKSIMIMGDPVDGTLSAEVSKLTDLEAIAIVQTGVGGTIPSEVGLLTSMHSAYLFGNEFEGTIPAELALLADSLTFELDLADNMLTGTIPLELYQLTELDRVYFSTNLLTGTIQTEVATMDRLYMFTNGNNMITGTVPTEIVSMPNLSVLHIDVNLLSGTIPTEVGKATSLKEFLVRHMLMTGSIPTELALATRMERIQLHNNSFTGTIPTEFGLVDTIEEITLHNSRLSGSIPTELGLLSNLGLLYLFENELTGSLPSQLGGATLLAIADLSNNKLTGSIPAELSSWTSLVGLSLAGNQLNGPIPNQLGGNFSFLFLGGNQLLYNTSSRPLCGLGEGEVDCPMPPTFGVNVDLLV